VLPITDQPGPLLKCVDNGHTSQLVPNPSYWPQESAGNGTVRLLVTLTRFLHQAADRFFRKRFLVSDLLIKWGGIHA
jgi:hypothetical protein